MASLNPTPGRSPNLTRVDPRLVDIVSGGAANLPNGYTVTVNEGYNAAGHVPSSQHHVAGSGALDVTIWDPQGNPIPNKGRDTTGMYGTLARNSYSYMLSNHPELKGKFASGMSFDTTRTSGVPDLMHFDLGGERGRKSPWAGMPIPPAGIPKAGAPPVAAAYTGGRPLTPAQQAAARVAAGRPPTLRKGDTDAKTGGAVTRLQQQLAALGFDVGKVDGDFGRRTEKAVRAATAKYGLTKDHPGWAGPQVQAALEANAPRDVALPRQRPDPSGPGAGLSAGAVPIGGPLSGMGAPPPTGIGRSDPIGAARPTVPVTGFPAAGAVPPPRADLLTRQDINRFDTEAFAPSVAPAPTAPVAQGDPAYQPPIGQGFPATGALPAGQFPITTWANRPGDTPPELDADRGQAEAGTPAEYAAEAAANGPALFGGKPIGGEQSGIVPFGTKVATGGPDAQQWSQLQRPYPVGDALTQAQLGLTNSESKMWDAFAGNPALAEAYKQGLGGTPPAAPGGPPVSLDTIYALNSRIDPNMGSGQSASDQAIRAALPGALETAGAAKAASLQQQQNIAQSYPGAGGMPRAPDGGPNIGSFPGDLARGWGVIGRGIGGAVAGAGDYLGGLFSADTPVAAKSSLPPPAVPAPSPGAYDWSNSYGAGLSAKPYPSVAPQQQGSIGQGFLQHASGYGPPAAGGLQDAPKYASLSGGVPVASAQPAPAFAPPKQGGLSGSGGNNYLIGSGGGPADPQSVPSDSPYSDAGAGGRYTQNWGQNRVLSSQQPVVGSTPFTAGGVGEAFKSQPNGPLAYAGDPPAPGGVPYATDPMARVAGFSNIGNGVMQTPQPKPSLAVRAAPFVASAVPVVGPLLSAIASSAMRGSLDNAQPYRGMTGGNYATLMTGGVPALTDYGTRQYSTGSSVSNSPFTPSGYTAPNFDQGSGGNLYSYQSNGMGGGSYVDSQGRVHSY